MRIAAMAFAACAFLLALPASAQPVCSVGDPAQVLWKGSWYPARVTRVNEDQTKCFVRYDGYGSEWDEWVSDNRIRIAGRAGPSYKVGDLVNVLWKGKWWPASVISARNGSWKVHYDGYNDSWDEWVDAGRIKRH